MASRRPGLFPGRHFRLAGGLTIAVLLASCMRERREFMERAPEPAYGSLSPDVLVLAPGESAKLSAQFFDSAGRPISVAALDFSSSDSTIALIDGGGRTTALSLGTVQLTATSGDAKAMTTVRVRAESKPAGPALIDVFPDRTYQTIHGWEASGQLGEVDCNPVAFEKYHDEVVHRAVNELGLTRVRLDLRSGTEQRTDTWPLFRSGQLSYPEWRGTWMVPENDNDDPFVADPAGFQWGKIDNSVEQVILPIKRALAARGESLFVNLNYIDFFLGASSKPFSHFDDPEEYAELVLQTFLHLKEKYGFVPDGLEILLEPENTPHTAEDVGRATVAVVARLSAAGFHPWIIAPSVTRAANAPLYYDKMLAIPGVAGLVDEIAYHRYTGISRPTLAAIANRARRDDVTTSMLEYISAGFGELYEDLTIANVSVWQQFTIAYCGKGPRPDATGIYYRLDESDPEAPIVTMTRNARLFRQVFVYVRPGATRIGSLSSTGVVRPLAFRNADGRIVVVAWSTDDGSGAGTPIEIRGLSPGRYGVNYSTTHGPYNKELPPVQAGSDGTVTITMPSAGVVTIYGM